MVNAIAVVLPVTSITCKSQFFAGLETFLDRAVEVFPLQRIS